MASGTDMPYALDPLSQQTCRRFMIGIILQVV
jgi:hypothetical protein